MRSGLTLLPHCSVEGDQATQELDAQAPEKLMASQEIEMPAYNIRIQIPHDADDDSGDDDLEEEDQEDVPDRDQVSARETILEGKVLVLWGKCRHGDGRNGAFACLVLCFGTCAQLGCVMCSVCADACGLCRCTLLAIDCRCALFETATSPKIKILSFEGVAAVYRIGEPNFGLRGQRLSSSVDVARA